MLTLFFLFFKNYKKRPYYKTICIYMCKFNVYFVQIDKNLLKISQLLILKLIDYYINIVGFKETIKYYQ
jgi:hypothetical protein